MPSIELGLFILLEHVWSLRKRNKGREATREMVRDANGRRLCRLSCSLDEMLAPPGSSRKLRCPAIITTEGPATDTVGAATIAFGNFIPSKRPSRQWGL
jgi:hypothetical protein